MSLYIGLDIGGTKFMAAAATANRKILRRIKAPSPQALNQGLHLLKEMVTEVAAGEKIEGIGAAIGGPLNWRTGVVSPLHQPEWRDVPLKEIMETEFRCPFNIDVDTNVAALGEYYSYPNPPKSLLYITISTGMGGGLVTGGRIYRGRKEEHPEIGHQSINFRCSHPEKVICECGAPDCLEALVSGNGIRRIYGRPPENLDSRQWEEMAFNLGQGLRNLGAIYLPEVIVLGGGVALGGGEKLLTKVYSVMQEHLKLVPAPQLHLSRLGYDTALVGAVYIAIHGNE
ncbi:MAG: ROK family protein [Candidatus Aminicenantes bacterium]|nr:ROK family protein [Candidatus Aminicenantes bacterium]